MSRGYDWKVIEPSSYPRLCPAIHFPSTLNLLHSPWIMLKVNVITACVFVVFNVFAQDEFFYTQIFSDARSMTPWPSIKF